MFASRVAFQNVTHSSIHGSSEPTAAAGSTVPAGPTGQGEQIGQAGQMGAHAVVQIAGNNGHATAQETLARAAAHPERSLASLQAESRTLTQRLQRHWEARGFLDNNEIRPNDMTCAMIVIGGIGLGLLLASIEPGSEELILPGAILFAVGCALGGRDSINCVRRGLHGRHLLEPQERQTLVQRRDQVDAAIQDLQDRQAVKQPVSVAGRGVDRSPGRQARPVAGGPWERPATRLTACPSARRIWKLPRTFKTLRPFAFTARRRASRGQAWRRSSPGTLRRIQRGPGRSPA